MKLLDKVNCTVGTIPVAEAAAQSRLLSLACTAAAQELAADGKLRTACAYNLLTSVAEAMDRIEPVLKDLARQILETHDLVNE